MFCCICHMPLHLANTVREYSSVVKNQTLLQLRMPLIRLYHTYLVTTPCARTWCKYKENPETFRYSSLPHGKPLSGEVLKCDLESIIRKYKSRSENLSDLGSTQANESFNNTVASKAPKARHYGGSISLRNRVSAAVLQKNEGHTYMKKVLEAANLSPGEFNIAVGQKLDKKKASEKEKKRGAVFKRRRIQLKKARRKNESIYTAKEIPTYSTGVEFDMTCLSSSDSIPDPLRLMGDEEFIVFDLETTGLSRKSDITQIAASTGNDNFQCYVYPRSEISPEASRVTGITFNRDTNRLYLNGKEVEGKTVHEALLDFMAYVESKTSPVLVGHNIQSFDIPVLTNLLREHGLYANFSQKVHGYIDTLKLARKVLPKEQVGGSYKLGCLVKLLPDIAEKFHAHNVNDDVMALRAIFERMLNEKCTVENLFYINFHSCKETYGDLLQKKVIKKTFVDRLSRSGISYRHLRVAFGRSASGLKAVFKEHKVTKAMYKGLMDHIQSEE